MIFKKILLASLIVLGLVLGSCSYFQKDKEDNTLRNLGILLFLSSSSTSNCSGSSGMVICIPKGIAE